MLMETKFLESCFLTHWYRNKDTREFIDSVASMDYAFPSRYLVQTHMLEYVGGGNG